MHIDIQSPMRFTFASDYEFLGFVIHNAIYGPEGISEALCRTLFGYNAESILDKVTGEGDGTWEYVIYDAFDYWLTYETDTIFPLINVLRGDLMKIFWDFIEEDFRCPAPTFIGCLAMHEWAHALECENPRNQETE